MVPACLQLFQEVLLYQTWSNQSHHMFASHQGDSLRELASVAVDNPMTTEGLVDPSGEHRLLLQGNAIQQGVMNSSRGLH